jgi:hypothetical protein
MLWINIFCWALLFLFCTTHHASIFGLWGLGGLIWGVQLHDAIRTHAFDELYNIHVLNDILYSTIL